MLKVTTNFLNSIKSPVRRPRAKVELYEGSTLAATYTQNDFIKSITIERVAEDSKFFGFGVIHKANIKLIDVAREKNISTANSFIISLGVEAASGIEYASYPKLYVSEVHRDENTNELSITAYDVLNEFKNNTVGALDLGSYTLSEFVEACGALLGVPVSYPDKIDAFSLSYATGANFEGTESLYEALTAAAEATQTIFYINASGILTFKRLDKDGDAVLTIGKDNYIAFKTGENRRLATIASVTELGDNVSASTAAAGTTQYIRNNPFLELREDIATLIDNALAAVGGLTINQFETSWRGNPALEVGDKIALTTKDDQKVTSFLLNDTVTYDGGLEEATEWQYTESEETESNPSSLGEVLKQTYAKVDKANKQIEIVASEASANSEAISALQINTESINASVQKIEANTAEAIEGVNSDISALTSRVEASVTAEEVNIAIKTEMENGASKVVTSTGFKFDDNGLHIAKTGGEMSSSYTDDGILIKRDDDDRLKVDNEGVWAYNLHAKTYLIVGESSRFEDYEKDGEVRTGCFWIGGGN